MHSFNVTFLKCNGDQSKKLKGNGVITISEDEVTLTRSEISGMFWNTPPETVTIRLADIANVFYNNDEKCIQFCEYRNGVFSGNPFDVYKFTLSSETDQNALFELLPKQVSEEVTLEAEFMEKLKQLTPYTFWTYAIIAICAFVFIAMCVLCGFDSLVTPTGITLLRFGADFGPLVADGEWYRIITSAFVHIGFVHILFNMVILWQIGHFVERLYGNLLFLVVYLGSAVAGSLMSLTMNPVVISAGASGAIFGLYGALLAYMLRRRGAIPLHMVSGIRNGAIAFIAFNFIYGMQAGIDNWCHLGGLLGGFFLGIIVAPPFESEERSRNSLLMAILGVALVVTGLVCFLSSNPTKLDPKVIGSTLTEFGIYYNYGNSELQIKKDLSAASAYYNRAMKYNNPIAIYNMGILYRDDDGIEKDEEKAFELFKQAADMGLQDAQSEYGRILYFDKENKKEGIEWLKKANENGSQSARFILACIYYDGDENVPQNQEFAIKEMNELADLKYQPAIDLLKQLEEESASATPNSEDESAPVENVEQNEN